MAIIKKIGLSIIALALILVPFANVRAAGSTLMFYNAGTDEYYVYSDAWSGTCEYSLSDTAGTPGTTVDCEDAGINYITSIPAVDAILNPYLWIDGVEYTLNYSVTSTMTLYSNEMINNIGTIIPTSAGRKSVVITNPGSYEYVIKKVDSTLISGVSYEDFFGITSYYETEACNGYITGNIPLSTENPLASLGTMLTYKADAQTLLAALTPGDWNPVVGNTIPMPTDAVTGDEYVVWIREAGSPETIDVAFMESCEENGVTVWKEMGVDRLPYTGADYTLFGLLGANVILLPIVYAKKRKLNKLVNES